MKEENAQIILRIIRGVSDILKDISPYTKSVSLSEDFKSLLYRLDQVNKTEILDPSIDAKIKEGYRLAVSYPKCLPPTENCRREHYDWGLKVQGFIFDLVKVFKEKGYDVGYTLEGELKAPQPFKLTEENILKIGLFVVVGIIIISLLKR